MYNFADDNTLSVANKNIETIIMELEMDIDILEKWFLNNELILNENKCQFLIAESKINPHKEIKTIKIANKYLKETKSAKLLGITVDNNITMDTHIRNICKKAGAKLSALARIAKFSCEQKRIILMRSFITSQFNYCPIIWMYCKRD